MLDLGELEALELRGILRKATVERKVARRPAAAVEGGSDTSHSRNLRNASNAKEGPHVARCNSGVVGGEGSEGPELLSARSLRGFMHDG
eukprot:scaffold275021_cov27-Tisochrysis_lutea.AAC.2